MNFFESQDRVRRNTAKLVILFVLAVITLVIMTNLLVMVTLGYISSEQLSSGETLIKQMDWRTFVAVSVGVGVVVLVGSLYKILALSAVGKAFDEPRTAQRLFSIGRKVNDMTTLGQFGDGRLEEAQVGEMTRQEQDLHA